MAERALTGELVASRRRGDRDHDCVPRDRRWPSCRRRSRGKSCSSGAREERTDATARFLAFCGAARSAAARARRPTRRCGPASVVDDRAHRRRPRAVGGQPRRRLGLGDRLRRRARSLAEIALGARRPPSMRRRALRARGQAARARHPARRLARSTSPARRPTRVFVDRRQHAQVITHRSPSPPRRPASSPRPTAARSTSSATRPATVTQDRSARSDTVVATLDVGEHPVGRLASAPTARSLYVSHLLLDAGVTVIDTAQLHRARRASSSPSSRRRRRQARRPTASRAASTPRCRGPATRRAVGAASAARDEDARSPTLDFQSTVFPDGLDARRRRRRRGRAPPLHAARRRRRRGRLQRRRLRPARASPSPPTASSRSWPIGRAKTCWSSTATAATSASWCARCRSAFLEGIAVDHAGTHAYVDGRNTHNVVVLDARRRRRHRARRRRRRRPSIASPPIRCRADLRLGQRLFYTANSAAFPHHAELLGRLLELPPRGRHRRRHLALHRRARATRRRTRAARSTPASCLRQALRNSVAEYDTTINIEQGGCFHRTDADAAAAPRRAGRRSSIYAIPFPQNPNRAPDGTLTDGADARQGAVPAELPRRCHTGEYLTDSGDGQSDARSRRRRSCSTTSAPA